MFCIKCGKVLPDDALFCSVCGASQSRDDSIYCIKCGKKLPQDSVFCTACGSRQDSTTSNAINESIPQSSFTDGSSNVNPSPVGSPVQKRIDVCSDKFVWPLATVPIAVSLLAPGVFGLKGTLLTVIVIVLNIVFMTLDVSELKKAGFNAEAWVWLGFILVPIYLFVRESKTNRNWAPGIVWCVLFVLDLII